VSLDCVIYHACYSILFGEGGVFPVTVYKLIYKHHRHGSAGPILRIF